MREFTKTPFSSGEPCSCISTATVTATYAWKRLLRSGVLAEGKASPHRWAPEQGYVTFRARNEKDLEPAMELIRMSHDYFVGWQNVLRAANGNNHDANEVGITE